MLYDESLYVDILIGLTGKSTCLRRKTSALLIDSLGSIVGWGTNGAPMGSRACTDTGICLRVSVPRGHALDQCVAVHAEMNAIADAHRKGIPVTGCTIFCTDSPCLNCMKQIVTSGIVRIRYLRDYPIACSSAYEEIMRNIDMEKIDVREIIESKSFDMSL